MPTLTPRQKEILDYIKSFSIKNGYPPGYRDIANEFKMNSLGTVYNLIKALKKKGLISNIKYHKLEITNSDSSHPPPEDREFSIPLIGFFKPGFPLELFAKSRSIDVPAILVREPDATYILQLSSNELQSEGFLEGDLLLIEARQEAFEGEWVILLIEKQTALIRKCYPQGAYMRLEQPKPNASSMVVPADSVHIQGAVIGLMRIYS